MLYAHEHCSPVGAFQPSCVRSKLYLIESFHKDHEVIDELHAQLTIQSTSSPLTSSALLSVGVFDWLTNNAESASRWLKRGLAEHPGSLDIMAALGWIELTASAASAGGKSTAWFDKVLEEDPKHLAVTVVSLYVRDMDLTANCAGFLWAHATRSFSETALQSNTRNDFTNHRIPSYVQTSLY